MQCALKTDTEMSLALDFHALLKGLGLEEEFPSFYTMASANRQNSV